MTDNQPAGLSAAIRNSLRELAQTFAAFLKAPRALWGVNIPYVFEGLVYFGILTILGKYCSENVALSDIHSGWVYGGVTGGITFAMLLFGGVSDKIGVRVSLALSLAASWSPSPAPFPWAAAWARPCSCSWPPACC
jgi:POT family proton-dependent oligopeptide transporter